MIENCFVSQVWDLFYQADAVRTMLTRLIREESLRTYLFTYSHVYDSISMETLAQMFELGKPVVHSIISKMIINEELMVRKTVLVAVFVVRSLEVRVSVIGESIGFFFSLQCCGEKKHFWEMNCTNYILLI